MKSQQEDVLDRIIQRGQRWLSALSRFQWRMAFLYTLVTVTAFTLLLGILYLFTSRTFVYSPMVVYVLPTLLEDVTAPLAKELAAPSPNPEVFTRWIESTRQGSSLTLSKTEEKDDTLSISYSLDTTISPNSWLIIANREGQIIAVDPAERFQTQQTIYEVLDKHYLSIVDHAMNGMNHPSMLTLQEKNSIFVAAPIRETPTSTVTGVVCLNLVVPSGWQMLGYTVQTLLSTTLFLSIGAGIIGLVFGLLVGRGLEKRLRAVAETAAAWGQGNFERRIEDRSGDEIGMLARELNKVAVQLQNLLNTREELATLEERNRLARDLHDSIKQQVFSISMNLSAAQELWDKDPAKARQIVETALMISRQSQQELNTLIQTLRPPQLEQKGLEKVLEDLTRLWEKQSGIPITYQQEGSITLDLEQQQALYRVAQEALSNVARHSGARSASVSLSIHEGYQWLCVRDDGHGFDTSQIPARGVGLRSMRERVESLGGTFVLESGSEGTCVQAGFPLSSSSHHREEEMS